MSREIKFRAWNEEQKQMALVSSLHSSMNIHVSYQKGEEKKGYFFGGNWVGADWNKDNAILMQFTGLKDKNGVDIYEGDIIEFHGNYTSLEKCGRGKIGVVTWSLDYMRFDLIVENLGIYDVASETDEWHYKRLVIGNIHENKN
jgi:uncharacterized phage protein (TIGR01671 family)